MLLTESIVKTVYFLKFSGQWKLFLITPKLHISKAMCWQRVNKCGILNKYSAKFNITAKKKKKNLKIAMYQKGMFFAWHRYYSILPLKFLLLGKAIVSILIKPQHMKLDLCIHLLSRELTKLKLIDESGIWTPLTDSTFHTSNC